MTTILLVRHASHDLLGKVLCGRRSATPLSEAGLAQAERVATRLNGEAVEAVYTSPAERTRATAEILARAAGVRAEVDEDLDEIDFGDWNGQSFETLREDPRWRLWNEQRSIARPPGGETMLEVLARVLRWLDRTRARHPDGAVVAVSHADVIKALLAHALGASIDFHGRFEVAPASLSRLAAGDWGLKVHCINETVP